MIARSGRAVLRTKRGTYLCEHAELDRAGVVTEAPPIWRAPRPERAPEPSFRGRSLASETSSLGCCCEPWDSPVAGP